MTIKLTFETPSFSFYLYHQILTMRKIFSFIFCLLLGVSAIAQELNVMTFNIRLNTASDSMNAWPYRKDMVASQVLFHEAHIVGVQEALLDQMTDLQERLPRYRYKGVGVMMVSGKVNSQHCFMIQRGSRLWNQKHFGFPKPGMGRKQELGCRDNEDCNLDQIQGQENKKDFLRI
jgi:hypothetical protein